MLSRLRTAAAAIQTKLGSSYLSDLFEYIKDKFFTVDYGDYENIKISSGGLVSAGSVILGIGVGIVIAAISAMFTRRIIGSFVKKVVADECFDEKSAKTLAELGYGKNPSVRGAVRSNQVLKKYLRVVTEDFDSAAKVNGDNAVLAVGQAAEAASEPGSESASEPMSEPVRGSESILGSAGDGEQADNIAELEKRLPDGVRRGSVSVANAGRLDLESARFFIDKERSYSAEVRFEKKGSNPVTVVLVACLIIVTALLAIKVLPDLLRMLDNFIGMVKGQ